MYFASSRAGQTEVWESGLHDWCSNCKSSTSYLVPVILYESEVWYWAWIIYHVLQHVHVTCQCYNIYNAWTTVLSLGWGEGSCGACCKTACSNLLLYDTKNCDIEQRYVYMPWGRKPEKIQGSKCISVSILSLLGQRHVCVPSFVSAGTSNLFCLHSLQSKYMLLD